MRILIFSQRGTVCRRPYYWIGVVVALTCFLFESVVCSNSELSNNGSDTTTASNNVTQENLQSRGSRQLWTLVKTVIKSGLEGSNSASNAVSGSGGLGGGGGGGSLGTLASLFGSAIASGINSDGVGGGQYYQQQQQQQHQQYYHRPNPNPSQFANPNDYMHYLLMNSQNNQHASLPHYLQQQQKEQESTADLIEKYKEEMTSGTTNVETATTTGNQLLSKLALGSIFDDLDKVSNLLSFARIENMVDKVNKFDKLKCIPRLLCQMVSKRKEDEKKEEEKKKAKEREDSDTSTKAPTNRKADDDDADEVDDDDDDDKTSRKFENEKNKDEDEKLDESKEKKESEEDEEDDDDEEDDSDEEAKEYVVVKKGAEEETKISNDEKDEKKNKKVKGRSGRFLKLNGSDGALEQFVRFLDLMQLKDWSLYPYLKGAYEGHQVTRTEECAYRFSSCPFSDDQLVYYFNNYNGGFFQSI